MNVHISCIQPFSCGSVQSLNIPIIEARLPKKTTTVNIILKIDAFLISYGSLLILSLLYLIQISSLDVL